MDLSIESRNVHYLDTGRGAPVVLLHPLPFDHTYWAPVVGPLARKRRVIAVDSRGFGGSSLGETPYQIHDLAHDLNLLLDHLRVHRAVIVGLSMGGYTALAFAEAFPDRVRGLALCATKAAPDLTVQKQSRNELASLVLERGTSAYIERQLPRLLSPAGMERCAPLVRELTANADPASVAAALHAIRDRPDRSVVLERAGWPVWMVFGADDVVTTAGDGNDMLAHLPPVPAEMVVIPGAGHLPSLEKTEAFSVALLHFLDSCLD